MEILQEYERKARKEHICNYCGGVIKKGERYHYSKIKGDDLYEWKSHLACIKAATGLWDFIDPDEGMSSDDFCDGCHEFCKTFICPDCEHYEKETEECLADDSFCVDKIAEIFENYDLIKDREGPLWWRWQLRERRQTSHD